MRQRLGAAVACALIFSTIAPPLFAQCVPDPAASNGALIAGGTNAGIIVKVAGVVIGGSPLPLALTSADLNSDGIINVSDVGIMVSHLGDTYPPGFGLDPVD